MTDKEKLEKCNILYNNLLPSIIKLSSNYQFLELTKEKFEELTKEFLIDIYNKQENKKLENNDYIKKIKSYLDIYVKITIKEPENSIKIINNYINITLSANKDSLKKLQSISSFLKKYDFIPTPDICIEVTKSNDILNKILKNIVEENIILITKKGIETLELDEISTTFIGIYCTLNNIELEKQEEQPEISEYYTEDSVKAYLKSLPRKILSIEEEQELGIRISQGDINALNTLVEHNLRLVVSIAKKYQNRGLDILDLIQEGNLGLMTAAKRYDYQRGLKFSSYATWWIRQGITRAIADQSRTIRVPVHMFEVINKITKTKSQLTQELNREPTDEELAQKMHISLDKLKEAISLKPDTLSLNGLVSDEDEAELEDFIPSNNDAPDEAYENQETSKNLRLLLEICCKNEKELDIMLLRYGLTGKRHTLEELGQKYGVTRERIRQIEEKVLRKLRMSKYQQILLVTQKKEESSINQSKSKSSPEVIRISIENIASIPIAKPEDIPVLGLLETFTNEGYTEDEIKSIIPYLGQEDKRIIELTNGKCLDKPIQSESIKIQDKKDYKWITIPRIRTMLISMYGSRSLKDSNNQEQIDRRPQVDLIIQNKQNNGKIKEKDKERDKMVETKKETSRKIKMTIFENLGRNGYTKEEVLDIINGLPEEDKKLINLINGNDLEHPVKSELVSQKDVTKYYSNLLPKIKRRLKSKYGIKEAKICTNSRKNDNIDNNNQDQTVVLEEPTIPDDNITKEEYVKILELIKKPTFTELMNELNPKTAIIIALRLGYIDNKYFSSASIAEFLGIEESEVRETTTEILKLYKNNIIEIIDKALTYEKSLGYTRKLTET